MRTSNSEPSATPSTQASAHRSWWERLRGPGLGAVLARRAGASFVVRIVGLFVAFGTQTLLARLLGANDFGDYVYVVTWLSVLVLLTKMGWDSASVRYVAEYRQRQQWDLFRGFIRTSTWSSVALAGIVSLVMVGTATLLADKLGPNLVRLFRIGALILPLNTLLLLQVGSLQGLKRVVAAQIPQQIWRPSCVAAGVLLLYLMFPESLGADAALWFNGLAALTAVAMTGVLFRRAAPPQTRSIQPRYAAREWTAVALPLLLVTGFSLLMNRFDILILGAMQGTKEAGIYSVASRISELTGFGILAVNMIAAPLIAELHAANKRNELQRVVSFGAAGIALFTVPAVLLTFVFGRPVLSLFGAEFVAGYLPLQVLVLGQAANALCGTVGFLMTMTGHQRQAAWIFAGASAVNLALNLILIPRLGMMGAALSTAATMALWGIVMGSFVRRRLAVEPSILGALSLR